MLFLALGLALLPSCDEDPIHPAPGCIAVSVVDASGPPVSNVEVRVAPLGVTALTDARGVALFTLPPGNYFVDAALCCRGPGFIEYHIPVTVTSLGTETVELRSCLACQ